jgi:pimeloyl-ACP methyl ester carboxylesterase
LESLRVTAPDGVPLHVEVTGTGPTVLFIHEFAGDHRSWQSQVDYLSPRYTCVAYAARGYLPSGVPPDPAAYSQDHAITDALAVLDAIGAGSAHAVGLSMGGFCALHLARLHPERVRSAVAGGVGYGAAPHRQAGFVRECDLIAAAFEEEGAAGVAPRYGVGPARVQFQNKDPAGHARFVEMLAEHSSLGSALTMRGFQGRRPSLYDFVDQFERMVTPVLVMVGDEDEGAIEASLMLKRAIPTSGLLMFPKTGHTLNLEEPELYNRALEDFLDRAGAGQWTARDPRSLVASITGIDRPGE